MSAVAAAELAAVGEGERVDDEVQPAPRLAYLGEDLVDGWRSPTSQGTMISAPTDLASGWRAAEGLALIGRRASRPGRPAPGRCPMRSTARWQPRRARACPPSAAGLAMSCSAMLAPNLARARFTRGSAVTRNLVPGRAAGCDGAPRAAAGEHSSHRAGGTRALHSYRRSRSCSTRRSRASRRPYARARWARRRRPDRASHAGALAHEAVVHLREAQTASCTPAAPSEWPVSDLVAEIGGMWSPKTSRIA